MLAFPIRPHSDGRPQVMGIVNVTPDSFSDGGRHASTQAARDHGLALLDAGADCLDVGGESTRPGAKPGFKKAEGGKPAFKKTEGGDRPLKRIKRKTDS